MSAAPAETCACSCGVVGEERLVEADGKLVCLGCAEVHAWHCHECGDADGVPTIVIYTFLSIPELRCERCHSPVEPIECSSCECHVEAGQVERDEGATFCRDCFEDDSCGSCGGSGGGDHPGIRCTSCRGLGVDRSKKRRR